MQSNDAETSTFLFRTTAWIWLGYLALLMGTEVYLSHVPLSSVGRFYLLNGSLALLFLVCALWPGLQGRLKRFYTPLMLVLIAGLPIAANSRWIGPLPPSPLSSIEGVTLRLLPVLLIGLIISAWQYPFSVVAIYSLLTTGLDIALLLLMPGNPDAITRVGFVTVVRLVIFLVVGYFISRLIQRLHAQQQQLSETNAHLVNYASTLEQLTISQERNRMARELHDTLAHTLSGLTVQLQTVKAYWEIEPETSQKLLDDALAATRDGLQETRGALKALRAAPLQDLGLPLAIRRMAEEAAARAGIDLHLEIRESLPSLAPEIGHALYRIAQEAIMNVVYHANAGTLSVVLKSNGDSIRLMVADDGRGFDTGQTPPSHWGVAGMRERAALVHGQLQIESRPGEGTTIQLTIPGRPT